MKSMLLLRFLGGVCLVSAAFAAQQPPSADLVSAGQRQFRNHCAGCHGGDGLGGERAPSIARPQSPRLRSDETIRNLLKQGIPEAGMPGFQLTEDQIKALVAFIQSRITPIGKLSLPGNAEAGKDFFFGQGQCSSCHMARGVGGFKGPDLTEVGRNRTLADVETALAKPENSREYQVATIRLKNGTSLEGFVKNRSNFDLQLQDFHAGLHLLKSDEIADLKEHDGPLMPALSATPEQKRDLLAYLASLNGETFEGVWLPGESTALHSAFEKVVSPPPGEWPTYHGSLTGNRFSPLDSISKSNLHRLAVTWSFPVKGSENLEGTPVVVGGVMYVTAGNQCYALDAASGREIWHYRRALTKGEGGDAGGGINRGVAVLGDRVFMVADNAHLLALHRLTGALLWDTEMADHKLRYGATSAPLVVNNLVITGTSGGDEGVRGFVSAYDAVTGKRVWRFWTAPEPGEPGSETWGNSPLEHRCVANWYTGTYDAETQTVFWPTGNPCPDFNGDGRPGDNLYSDSIIALEPATGKLRWHFQFTPHDTHDWDAAEPPLLVDADYHGQPRKLLLQGNRNGYFYVLDRTNGQFLAAYPFVKLLTWSDGIDEHGRPRVRPGSEPTVTGNKVCPSVEGASNWMSSGFNPNTGLFYLMALEKCSIYTKSLTKPGESFYGGDTREIPGFRAQKFLRAIDIQTGKLAWEIPQTGSGETWGGTLTTAANLVFFCNDGGSFDAADAKSGELLWHFQLNQAWHASPMTYMVNGKQYIAVAAGSNIMVFALTGA
jgi:PQQ-dependent dehydrogenase (methanol/ethanol family)